MANKLRDFDKLIDHSNDPVANLQMSKLEKENDKPAQDETYSDEKYLKIHDRRIAINVVRQALENVFRSAPPPNYRGEPQSGIYQMPGEAELGEINIALLGDWGTYTRESVNLAKNVADKKPDYTIHLGDTYFTGSDDEIDQCFNPDNKVWCYGRLGSFALLGNHEMYSEGVNYYDTLLEKWMGIWNDGNVANRRQQDYSYFCLENEHWRIIALDTGTDSHYSLVSRIKSFLHPSGDLLSGNTRLDIKDNQLKWLEKEVFNNPGDKRGIILLTHHQPWGIFKNYAYPVPATTLARPELIGPSKRILWFWGHEHYFSMYGCSKGDHVVKAFGRCLGHAGMPVELNEKKKDKDDNKVHRKEPVKTDKKGRPNTGFDYLALYDLRERSTAQNSQQTPLGYNGYACITLNKDIATVKYYGYNPETDQSDILVSESWTVTDGNLTGTIDPKVADGLGIIDINKAVRP